MYRLGLSVKDDSIFKILEYVLFNNDCTVNEIADACKVSTPTVSKVLRFFLDKGLFYKHLVKEKAGNAHRAYRYCIDPKYNIVVYTYHDRRFRAALYALMSTSPVRDESYFVKKPFDIEKIRDFSDRFNERFPLTSLQYRLGYSVIVKPETEEEEIKRTQAVTDFFKDRITTPEKSYPFTRRFIAIDSFEAAKLFFSKDKRYSSEVVLYIRYNKDEMYHMIFNSDESLSVPVTTDLTDCFYDEDPAIKVITVIEELYFKYGVTRVFIDSDDYKFISSMILMIRKEAEKDHPDVVPVLERIETIDVSKPSVSEMGAAIRIKELFLEDIIKKLSE